MELEFLTLRQRVGNIVVIEHTQAAHAQARPCIVEVNFKGIRFHRDHAEHVVAINVYVVVMNLVS